MKITLQESGREMITLQMENGEEKVLPEGKIVAIVESYFSANKTADLVQNFAEGERFEVNPSTIKWDLFEKERKDPQQEETWRLILDAYQQLEEHPEKYNWIFETLVPKKTWTVKTVNELEDYAIELGGFEADWVWQALEWAQRISNGNGSEKAWKKVCNDADTNNWYRLIKWKNGCHRLVGGARVFINSICNDPASYVGGGSFYSFYSIGYTVPLVVLKKVALTTVK